MTRPSLALLQKPPRSNPRFCKQKTSKRGLLFYALPTYYFLNNSKNSFLLMPASLKMLIKVPLGKSLIWQGTTARFLLLGLYKTKWLPVIWSTRKPSFCKIFSKFLGVITGSLDINRGFLYVYGSKKTFLIGGDWFFMFF